MPKPHLLRSLHPIFLLAAVAALSCRSRPQPVLPPAQSELGVVPSGGAVCAAGEMRCEGAALQRCAEDGTSFVTVQTCRSAALCDARSASCGAATCLADEMTCRGSELHVCNAERTDFELFDTCESPAHCSATTRRCLETPCAAGDLRCNRSADSAAVLERCGEGDWGALDVCATRQLCDETLSNSAGALTINSDGQIEVAFEETEVSSCLLAACRPGELRCEGASLVRCSEGQTHFELVEQCASASLCEQSVASGAESCPEAECQAGEFRCSLDGALEVCGDDRTGYRLVQQCIGAAFCDAADGTCNDAPCPPGAQSCNGPQPQRCREDQTGFDPIGEPCVTSALCNDDGESAFCEEPTCRRGELSGDEYACDGALLSRCNENLTGYDAVETCAAPELCDASARECRAPLCELGEHRCEGALLQLCNAGRTGFDTAENCGDASQCDAALGACSDPCEPGSSRCTPQGRIEECRDRLTGWQEVADCLTPQLCDAEEGCTPPLCAEGATRCRPEGASAVLERCPRGRERFDEVATCQPDELCDAVANQCDECEAGSVRCDGDTLVRCSADGQSETRQRCGSGLCSAEAGRCLACDPIGSARCNGLQLLVCTAGSQGEFESSQDCDTPELCADTLRSCDGGSCTCREGICGPGEVRCQGNDLVQCNAGQNGFNVLETCPAGLCNAGQRRCDECSGNGSTCVSGNRRRFCSGGLFQEQTCANGQICNGETGRCFVPECNVNEMECFGNALRLCNDNRTAFEFVENCQPGLCNVGQRRCDECSGNGATCLNANQRRVCSGGLFQTQNCGNNATCVNGQCEDIICSPGQMNCFGNALQRCSADRTQFDFVENCPNGLCNQGAGRCDQCSTASFQPTCATNTSRRFCSGGLIQTQQCGAGNVCQNGQCVRNTICTPGQQQCLDDLTLGRCSADRTEFEPFTLCTAGGCNRAQNRCNTCVVGQPDLCIASNVRRTCVGGQTQDLTCSANQRCENGRCITNECNANTPPTCPTTTTRRFCSGGSFVTQSCGAGSACRGGQCVANECNTQTPSTCANSTSRRTCQNGQFVNVACPAGTTCFDGSCVRRVCTPGTRCQGSALLTCNAAGTQESGVGCTFGCNTQRLECNVCRPNELVRCSSTTSVSVCRNTGAGTFTRPCPANNVCDLDEADGCRFVPPTPR